MWLESDTDYVLAWMDYQSSLCSGCGQLKSESMDPANDRAYEAVPIQCFACATKDAEMRKAGEASSSGSMGKSAFDGLYIAVQSRGVTERGR